MMEICRMKRKNASKQTIKNEMQVKAAVDLFIEKWYEEGGCTCVFTREEIDRKFMNPSEAKNVFIQAGCNVKVTSSYKSGALWWKKRYPEIWEIQIPVSIRKDEWGIQI